MIIGYTQGTFDLFHVGHLNLLKKASEQCDYLIVGVNSDELVENYKNKTPIIPQNDRMEIIRHIVGVDEVVLTTTLDKNVALEKYKFNKIFIGDDWKDSERWKTTEKELTAKGVSFVWVTYTEGISSTMIRNRMIK